jgi:hypothetical protein
VASGQWEAELSIWRLAGVVLSSSERGVSGRVSVPFQQWWGRTPACGLWPVAGCPSAVEPGFGRRVLELEREISDRRRECALPGVVSVEPRNSGQWPVASGHWVVKQEVGWRVPELEWERSEWRGECALREW